jgi:hypothetical protein
MEIAPIQPMAMNPSMKTVANAYARNSPLTPNSLAYSMDAWTDAEKAWNLKKELIAAIDCGNFQMALYILDRLIELQKK